MDEIQRLLHQVQDPNVKMILAIFKERILVLEQEVNRVKVQAGRGDHRLNPIGSGGGGPTIG